MLEVGEPEGGGRTGLAAQHEATASVRAGLAAELDAPPVFKSGEEVFDVVALAVEPPLVVWLQYFKQAAQRPFHRLH
ncbi:hypothetical protein K9B32_23230 [Rhizobium sp. 3T7]|uniref:hypothetical protein n=1 Tax=Rhizobium sp. 3T7 TaxID=2874922 RepID=UPI001CCE8B12|nr:hypothetical protein [Rhizobium sp. 3T7]MBZ9792979.1 hypothetical protein [Rhizobium sp. 3T7]